MLLTTPLSMVHILGLNGHAGWPDRPCLDVQIRNHRLIVLPYRRGHLIEVASRRPIRCRLDLKVARIGFKAVALGDVLGRVDRIVDLEVLQGHFFVLGSLLTCLLQVDVRIFRTL